MTETRDMDHHDSNTPAPPREPETQQPDVAALAREALELCKQSSWNRADLERIGELLPQLARSVLESCRAAEGEQREQMEQQQADLIRDAARWRAVRETAITQTIFPNGGSWLYTQQRVLAGIIRTPDEYADALRALRSPQPPEEKRNG